MSEYIFRRTGHDASQLAWDIEDQTDLRIGGSGSEDIDTLEGYMNTGPDIIKIVLYEESTIPKAPAGLNYRARTLTPPEEARLRHVVENHVARPMIYRGNMALAVTRYASSVGRILVKNSATKDERFATGFLFARCDMLLTAAHVVEHPLMVQHIEFDNMSVEGKVVRHDPKADIALVELCREIQAPPLRIRRAITTPGDLGMECVVMGFPNIPGMEPSLSVYELRLTSLRRNYIMGQDTIELSTPLSSGCSGAPILSARHSLIGMVIGYPDDQMDDYGTPRAYRWPKWNTVAVQCNELDAWWRKDGQGA